MPLRLSNPLPRRFRGFTPRVALVGAGMLLAAAALALRAVDLQVLRHDELSRMANRQSQRILRIKGQRGPILDRTGGELAVSVQADSVYARPSRIDQPAQAAYRLARVLNVPRATLEERFSSDAPFVWIKRRIAPEESERVAALELAGLGMTREYLRVYPGRSYASALLGFTGVDTQGLEGLEYAFDSYLKGTEVYRVLDMDALGRTLLQTDEAKPTAGDSVRLTIHPAIQYLAEHEVGLAVARTQASYGLAVVMRSATGEILAMAQAPGFNPNAYAASDKSAFFNRAITSGYEPGSTFKVITAATALEEKSVKPDTVFYCEKGEFQHYDSIIHDTEPHAWLTVASILRVSSNIGAAKMGLTIPASVFRESLFRFGFGQRTGIFTLPDGRRLAGEADGYVLPANKWTPVDHAAISFGHGVLVSPLQLVTAVNAIATGGRLLRPWIVQEIRDPQGKVLMQGRPAVVRRAVSAETAAAVRDLMLGVVQGDGTGTRAAVPGFAVAGKTGTTEKYDLLARGYSKTKDIASFVGFVPAEAPEVTILVLVEDPKTSHSGGLTAAPVFREIAKGSLAALGVWPKEGVRRVALGK
ncbi:MAG: peptidoglycan D,D-transpeptidase FtsI family protein [SAR324 cluster bacterium]